MAKVFEHRWTETVQHIRREIVCETCGKLSGLVGPQAIAKWEGKPWYCPDHRPNYLDRRPKPKCVCGHNKSRHSGGKGSCNVTVGQQGRMKGFLNYKQRKYPRNDEHWKDCECQKYQPKEADA